MNTEYSVPNDNFCSALKAEYPAGYEMYISTVA